MYLEFVDGYPRVWGESLDVWHEELDAAIPVSKQQHSHDKVDDSCNGSGCSKKLCEGKEEKSSNWSR